MKIKKLRQLIQKSAFLGCLLMIAFSLLSVIVTSKSSPVSIQSVFNQQINEPHSHEVVISKTSHSIQPLGFSESFLKRIVLVIYLLKQNIVKHYLNCLSSCNFSKSYWDPINLFSYEFLRLNILSAKHHPPTVS